MTEAELRHSRGIRPDSAHVGPDLGLWEHHTDLHIAIVRRVAAGRPVTELLSATALLTCDNPSVRWGVPIFSRAYSRVVPGRPAATSITAPVIDREGGVPVELVDIYRRLLMEFVDRVGRIRPQQWSAPTPCADWDVRALVNHVVNEDRWTVPIFAGRTVQEVGGQFDGDLLGSDPLGNATDAAKQAEAAVSEPGAMQRTVHLSFGDFPADEYLRQLLADHLVHGWDLAVAIGADATLDPAALRSCADWFAEREDLYRQGGAIGPRVPLDPSASEQDRLLAAFGRDPAWRPPGPA
jgi:uncharacterized protein (TIGR03086 family)